MSILVTDVSYVVVTVLPPLVFRAALRYATVLITVSNMYSSHNSRPAVMLAGNTPSSNREVLP